MKPPQKFNRRTRWKFARDLARFLYQDAYTWSFGPAGRSSRYFRHFVSVRGQPGKTVAARSEQAAWEKFAREICKLRHTHG